MQVRFLKMIHQKCVRGLYPLSNIHRFEVTEDKIPWTVAYPEYNPIDYTALYIHDKPWADPEIEEPSFKPNWNSIDGQVNRQSFVGYVINEDGVPLNPIGRTGIEGRGLLGRWGPNHAADSVVTRWKRNSTGAVEIDRSSEKPILQFVAIERLSGDWAIPGGMVDPDEVVITTLRREFMEEALDSLNLEDAEKAELESAMSTFFEKGDEIYKGYVDDPRNTDNAWIETVVVNFHDEDGSTVGKMNLKTGDDVSGVKWMDINRKLDLYASHTEFIKQVMHKHNAHW